MKQLKGIDAILMITAQLMLEGIHCESELGNQVRIQQASMLIKACSEVSNKSVLDLMLMCKSIAVSMERDFSKHERVVSADDILNKIFSDDKKDSDNG